jgi:hypothetical protein
MADEANVEYTYERETKNFAIYQGDGNTGTLYLPLPLYERLGKPKKVQGAFTASG